MAKPGENNVNAKIRTRDVLNIRARAADGMSHEKLGREFGLSQAHVSRIVRRDSWAHVA